MPTTPKHLPRRTLVPRDYLVQPAAFGRTAEAEIHLPEGGDVPSMRAAIIQHRLAVQLAQHAKTGHGPGARLGRLFGFSRQHWSDALAGRSWMREDALLASHAVLLDLLDELEPRRLG
jgi:hypothetical protein